jgi:hypothetical protein
VLIVEIMANAIRQNPKISGIKIGDAEFKISQYADDTCLYVADLDSIKAVFKVLDIFTKCSGLKVNKEKSEALGIGTSSNFRHKEIGIKWPITSVKCLGIFINANTEKMVEDNFKPCIERIEQLLSLWCLRKLTLKGKVLIINSHIISQLLYVCTVLYTPKWVLKKYEELIKAFLWNKKTAKVKYKSLINTIEDGGLRLQDLESKIKAIKCKWYKNMIKEDYTAPWKAYLRHQFREDLDKVLSYNSTYNDFPVMKDEFYAELFKVWAQIHCHDPINAEEVCRQPLWHNTFIRI